MEEIYKEYSKIVFCYLLSLTNNNEIAEDLTQSTFYSAVKSINKFRNESSLKTWLCKIAKNKWLDYYEKTKRCNETNIDEVNNKFLIEKSFEDDYADREDILNLYKKIHKLDEESKEVIYLRIRGELRFKEIGLIMGKSEEWVRITFYRAKIKLKEDFYNG